MMETTTEEEGSEDEDEGEETEASEQEVSCVFWNIPSWNILISGRGQFVNNIGGAPPIVKKKLAIGRNVFCESDEEEEEADQTVKREVKEKKWTFMTHSFLTMAMNDE